MTTLATMRRQRRWLYSQGFTETTAVMDKVIETFTQEAGNGKDGHKGTQDA